MGKLYLAAFFIVVLLAAGAAYRMNNPRAQSDGAMQTTEDLPLTGTKWVWLHTELPNGTLISTPARERYVLTLSDTSAMMSTTDCNTFMGSFMVDDSLISFSDLSSTKKLCEDSIELIYSKHLGLASSYDITANRLTIHLRKGNGDMVFERQ
jgi:heat shock protein HslJ